MLVNQISGFPIKYHNGNKKHCTGNDHDHWSHGIALHIFKIEDIKQIYGYAGAQQKQNDVFLMAGLC